MKSSTLVIGGVVVVAAYFGYRAFASMKKAVVDAAYTSGEPGAPLPPSYWTGTNWQDGPAAPGNTPPNGSVPQPPNVATLLLPGDWANTAVRLAATQAPPIGTTGVLASELRSPPPLLSAYVAG